MAKQLVLAIGLALALGLAIGGAAAGHSGGEGSGISVEPTQVTAGGTVVLAGQGLEPNSERQISLVGPDVVVPYPAVTTDAEGMFAVTLTIPAHLPSGTYTFQAIADETLTAELAVTAAPGAGAVAPVNETAATVGSRSRAGVEIAALVVLVVVLAGAGIFLVTRAERLGRRLERS
jgi:hypothetical protein